MFPEHIAPMLVTRSFLLGGNMERTEFKDGTITVGELEFTTLMRRLIHAYQFRGNGDLPDKVILPDVKEIEGVLIEFPVKEVKDAVTSGKPNARK